MSLELQQAFGLRREESIKFIPTYADQGDHLTLKPSWTKGGKARVIPIRTEEQWKVLNRTHKLAGKGSLIPSTGITGNSFESTRATISPDRSGQ